MKKIIFGILFLITSMSWAAPDWTKAEVVKIDPARHRVLLKHETIKSIGMDPMTMLFDVAPKLPLQNYKAGDRVRFQVKMSDGALEVTALEKAP